VNYVIPASGHTLPSMIDRAAAALMGAKTAAEILEAREFASQAYDAAKRAARMAKAKDAHDSLIAAAHRAQADALDIEAQAKRRLADEYDAAQERGEVRGPNERTVSNPETVGFRDLGLTGKEIHEARQIRDAEVASPGVVRRALDERLNRGQEPNKAYLREIVTEAAMRGLRPAPTESRRNPDYSPDPAFQAMASVIGSCTSIIERLAACPPTAIASRLGDGARRATNVGQIRRAHSDLTKLLEVIDAE
jgi:hypothetical protein